MKLALPPIELTRGTTTCLHIPQGCADVGEPVEAEVLHLAYRQGKTAAIARRADVLRAGELSLSESCADWLSRAGGISQTQSARIVAQLGVTLADWLVQNAGTPRSLLGIAAALVRGPDVLIYATKALDPEGCWTAHQFVHSRCQHLCVVHISYPHVFGDGSPHPRYCPQGARCLTVTAAL